jgi:hypothetical protein
MVALRDHLQLLFLVEDLYPTSFNLTCDFIHLYFSLVSRPVSSAYPPVSTHDLLSQAYFGKNRGEWCLSSRHGMTNNEYFSHDMILLVGNHKTYVFIVFLASKRWTLVTSFTCIFH